jgi:hypothetical protein
MLVELNRPVERSDEDGGEDDGLGHEVHASPIKINPIYVAAVFPSRHDGVCIVRLSDGRGFKVIGTYAEVSEKLSVAGRLHAIDE